MALVIETGTGSATAEAYADAVAYVAWATAYNGTAPTATTTAQEAAIRRAVAYLDGLRWSGVKSFGRVQARSWPRSGVVDVDGYSVNGTTIPPEVIEAQHMLTQAEIAAPGCLAPEVAASKRQRVLTGLGDLSWDMVAGSGAAEMQRTVVLAAMDRVRGLIVAGNQMVRA